MSSSIATRPQGCTALKLKRLSRLVNRHFDAEVGRVGLKITQYSLLSYVVRLGPLRPVDLAAELGLEPSTLTRNLRPLVEQGWVRIEDGPDARSRSVVATDAGVAKRAEAQRRWRAAQESLNERLGADHVIALHALLDLAGERLQSDDTGEDDE